MKSNSMLAIAFFAVAVFVTAHSHADEPKRTTIRVLSYNIHHGEGTDGKVDLPRLSQVILQTKADLVAVQEVDDKTKRTGGVDQTAELVRLTGLHGKFGKAIDYEGGGYGQTILSRFPIDEIKVHLLPGMPDRERRIAAEAKLKFGDNQPLVSFVTTHLHHQNAEFREQQVAELNRLFGSAPHPVILAGDMNALPDSKAFKTLLTQWQNATDKPNLFTIPAGKPNRQIDYVLYRPEGKFRALEVKVIDEAVASDHRPILAVLEFMP